LAAAPAVDSQAAYTVVLDVFSGRPNPVLELTADEVGGLSRLMGGSCEKTPLAKPAGYPSSFLGYRGITVFRSAPGSGRVPSLRLARGAIRVSAANVPDACKAGVRSSTDHAFPDIDRKVEMYLIDVAHTRKVIDDIVYNDIVSDMKANP
jgi:hypothetical protein